MICLHCQQTISGQVQSRIPCISGSRDDQIASIHRETCRLDQLIAQLNEERAALLRRLNAIQSPAVNLPPETLSHIFEYACPPPDLNTKEPASSRHPGKTTKDNHDPQLTLGAVSSHWHQVVRSSPNLWARIALHITGETVEKKAALLRLFIENSGEVSLAIAINFRNIDPESLCLVYETVDSLLVENLPRIKELYLTNPPCGWHNHTISLTRLRSLSLQLRYPDRFLPNGRITLPLNAPLHRLFLQGGPLRSLIKFQVPWMTLTSLDLSSMPPDVSVQVFIQCLNLIDFRCCSPLRWYPDPDPVTLTRPVSFRHLVSFHWETSESHWGRALIQYMHVPVLREMHWKTFHDADSVDGNLRAFFNRLPPTLTMFDSKGFYLEHLPGDSNIEEVVLRDCTPRDIRTLLSKLQPKWQGEQRVTPLPQLKRISIVGRLYHEETMMEVNYLAPSYSTALVDVLERRLGEPGGTFTLEAQFHLFKWRSGARARLSELIAMGHHIQVLEGPQIPDW